MLSSELMFVPKIIEIDILDIKSIKKAIDYLDNYVASIESKKEMLTKRLSDIGLSEATIRFSSAYTGGNMNDVTVSVKKLKRGYSIVASGKEVCFIEFGAGVYYNGTEPYPNPRPTGIVGIGQYGQGKGSRSGWYYRDENGAKHFTRGTPSAMPMYWASKEMQHAVTRIAKEVFKFA